MAERDRTKHELEEFSKAYARRRRLLIVCNIVGGGALLGLIVMQFTDFRGTVLGISMSSNLVFGILLGIAIVASIVVLAKWRCPACNKWLGRNLGVDACPRCDVSFGRITSSGVSIAAPKD